MDLWARQQDAFGDINIVPRACPLCGDTNEATPASRYSLGIWTVKNCRDCGFTYITSAPDYHALFEQMSWEKSSKLEAERRESTRGVQQSISKRTRWRMRLLRRKTMADLLARHAAPGNVVDLGCGDGGQLVGLSAGFVPHGIEISTDSAAAADAWFRKDGGRAVNAPCLEGLAAFPDGFFTAATLRSYLEHELHPAEVLHEVHRVLVDGGVAIVKVPNFAALNRRLMGARWCGFRHPDHLNYFTPRTLRLMAQRTGFDMWAGATWAPPTSDNMWALLRKRHGAS